MTKEIVINQGMFSFKNNEDFFKKIEKKNLEETKALEKEEIERKKNLRIKVDLEAFLRTAQWLRSNNPEKIENYC